MENKLTTKGFFGQQNIKSKFEELLGNKATGFITSVMQVVNSSDLLAKADPKSVYNAAATAAILDLPINNNLGFAYIVPYKGQAQFQLGYKGFIQLAQRSGAFKTISATPIYEGQLIEENPLTGFVFDFTKKTSDKIVGYAAYFKLLNGFEKTLYMSSTQATSHGKRFSQTFKKGFGLWVDDFDSMALKTVTKLLLSKYAPLSIDMQKAIVTDQSVINDHETEDVTYVDNEIITVDKEAERVILMINDAKTIAELENVGGQIDMTPAQIELFNQKKEALINGSK